MNLVFDAGTLVLNHVPEGVKLPGWFQWDGRIDKWRAQAYKYRDTVEYFTKAKIPFTDKARNYKALKLASSMKPTPHPHQSEALDTWENAGRRGMIELPTGSGKSYVAQLAIELAQRSTLVVAPTIDLMNQWYDLLTTAFNIDVGIIGGKYHEVQSVTVTTYDSAHIYMEKIGHHWGLIVFDECHHLPGPVYGHAAEMCLAPYRLGLTATLEREDGRHELLYDLIGPLVYRKGIKELAGEFLSDYIVRRLRIELGPEERKQYEEAREEYTSYVAEKGLSLSDLYGWKKFIKFSATEEAGRRAMQAYQRSRRITQGTEAKLRALDGLLKQHRRDRVIIFTLDNETVYTISQNFLIPAITHQTDTKERHEILNRFNRGEYKAIVTSKVLNEGVNVPEANIAIILSGSASVREHVQRLGRVLRRREGKQAILYEVITSNTFEEKVSRRRRRHDAYR